MGEKEFWDLIAWANAQADHSEERAEALEDALRTLNLEQIEDFYLLYDQCVTRAWTKELKCAAYVINRYGDALDDQDFLWFICWLSDRGKRVYDAALANPDALADIDEALPWGADGYWGCASDAWQIETNRPESDFADRVLERGASGPVALPSGGGTSDRYLKKRYPRLYRRFVEEDVE
jgi:hypothetical protein